jgi:hypothetical protein
MHRKILRKMRCFSHTNIRHNPAADVLFDRRLAAAQHESMRAVPIDDGEFKITVNWRFR